MHPNINNSIDTFLEEQLATSPDFGKKFAELLDVSFSPLEDRRSRWIKNLDQAVIILSENFHKKIANLATDQRFISALVKGSRIAAQTHWDETLSALQNIIIGIGSESIDEEVSHLFFKLIETLSIGEVHLLLQIQQNRNAFESMHSLEDIHCVCVKNQTIYSDRTLFQQHMKELARWLLIDFGDIEDIVEFKSKRAVLELGSSATQPFKITSLGISFIETIQGRFQDL